jgi:hypothetical protein
VCAGRYLLELPPDSPVPPARATACSAITEDNQVFVYGGRPLESVAHGALGPVLDDLWSFNARCPPSIPVMQPSAEAGAVETAAEEPAKGGGMHPGLLGDPASEVQTVPQMLARRRS